MNKASTRGILVGWALGAWDGGLALSANAHYASSIWSLVMGVLTPAMIYGWGGWVLGRLPFRRLLPWDLLYFAGAVIVTHLRRWSYLGNDGWWWIGGAAALSLLLWFWSRGTELDPAEVEQRRARRHVPALALPVAAANVLLALYALLRVRHFLHGTPQTRGAALDLSPELQFPTDLGWLAAAAGMVFAIVRSVFPPAPRRAGAWVPRLSGLLLLLVPAAALYLHFELREEPIVTPPPEPAAAAPPGAPNVILISWDTVRADTLPLFGGGGLDMPELQALADQGVLFTGYHTVAPITAPAHNSMLTGLYPPSHGVRDNGQMVVGLDTPRLPELFRSRGYATGAFVSALPLRRAHAFHHGFDYFDDRAQLASWSPLVHMLGFARTFTVLGDRFLPANLAFFTYTTPGRATTERAVQWYLAQDRPVFLWVHLFDAHDPRDLHEPYASAVQARRAEGPRPVNSECEQSWVEQRAEVALLDALLGELRAAFEQKDPGLANTVIALVADHGECFGEGREVPEIYGEGGVKVLHAPSLFEATQHVVGLIVPPAGRSDVQRGLRAGADAGHVDLLPTLCELAGLAPPPVHGRSLLPALRGEPLPARGFFMEALSEANGSYKLQGWLKAPWKYVRLIDGSREFLYRLDSGDAVDHAAQQPELLAELRGELDEFLRTVKVVESRAAALSGADQAGLAELGYAGEGEDEEERP